MKDDVISGSCGKDGHNRIHLRGRSNGLELVNKEIENSKGNLWVVYKITDEC